MDLLIYLLSGCSVVYGTLAVLIGVQARQRANMLLAFCCSVTALWAAYGAASVNSAAATSDSLIDLLRLLAWYSYLLYLYTQAKVAPHWQIYGFSVVAVGAFFAGLATTSITDPALPYALLSWSVALRLAVSICELLLIENLYFNLPESTRWHIALPCVLLAGLACFDILVIADGVLFHRPSTPLACARVIAMIAVAPLLVLAAFRGQRWSEPVRLSRAAVFHSATLVLSGSVLLSLAAAGEIFRRLDADWGWIAELSLGFLSLIAILLFVSSRTAKSLLDRLVVSHFFADRYDYRAQWLNCIATLSGRDSTERVELFTRVIRAVADIVDSPNGALFLRDEATDTVVWANSWNMPASNHLWPTHPLMQTLGLEKRPIEISQVVAQATAEDPIFQLGRVWLAIPLFHKFEIIGVVIVGPPRVSFRLDQEVFDLLGILGQEVGSHVAEQQATQAVVRTRSLHDYGKRFSFVAHDIKNVSSQLALLLSNAELYLDNPEFQRDMLETVRSSVRKIDRLLGRLDGSSTDAQQVSICLVPRLHALLASYRSVWPVALNVEHAGPPAWITIGPEAFDTAVIHLINNAGEAAPEKPVHIEVRSEVERVTVEVTDQGRGMSPEFIRDELFSPLKTKRVGGSGIGAFQARELIYEAGGELTVISKPGVGTTMRLTFSKAENFKSRLALSVSPDVPGK